jgi:hypothetical protein
MNNKVNIDIINKKLNNIMVTRLNSNKSNTFNLLVILTIILIIIILVLYFNRYINNLKNKIQYKNTYIETIHDAKKEQTFIISNSIVEDIGNEFNYNMWIYITDYTYRDTEDKCILYKGSNFKDASMNNYGSPSIWLLKNTNTLRVQMEMDMIFDNEITGIEDNKKICDVEDIPLQTWVNINVSIMGSVLDIYLNGYLVKTCVLSGQPRRDTNNILICPNGGFDGFIANLLTSNKSYSSREILNIYKNGPVLQKYL